MYLGKLCVNKAEIPAFAGMTEQVSFLRMQESPCFQHRNDISNTITGDLIYPKNPDIYRNISTIGYVPAAPEAVVWCSNFNQIMEVSPCFFIYFLSN